ncbi:AGAP005791-PA-like protein [Anopheles sinensis]|uniref:AGAP005791-PA-like protein n=1 Tax=Anopheles sinensis TaxID=74873 RepID=A0A084WDK4_ANOSI|nr:AGAP005791-PA-like protein [Anopheles sinensis]
MALVQVLLLTIVCVFPAVVLSQLRILGGYDASRSRYPFVAIIAHSRTVVGNGAILAPKWVVTSGSALYMPSETEYCAVIGGDSLSTSNNWHEAERVWKHPDWIGWHNNVGLLQLKKPIVYGPTVKPIKLASTNPDRLLAEVVSYGQNDRGTSQLQMGLFLLSSDSECINSLKEYLSRDIIRIGHGYCVSPTNDRKYVLWWNDAGAPAIADDLLYGVFAIGDYYDDAPTDYVATRLGSQDLRDWIYSKVNA